jgi:hypothetical protein
MRLNIDACFASHVLQHVANNTVFNTLIRIGVNRLASTVQWCIYRHSSCVVCPVHVRFLGCIRVGCIACPSPQQAVNWLAAWELSVCSAAQEVRVLRDARWQQKCTDCCCTSDVEQYCMNACQLSVRLLFVGS